MILGGVFTVSGVGKLISREDAKSLVELLASEVYWVIEYADAIVLSITIFELALAIALLIGWKPMVTFAVTDLFLMFFIVVLGYFYISGYEVESCGCFGAFGSSGGIGTTLIRDLILLVIANVGLILTIILRLNDQINPTESVES